MTQGLRGRAGHGLRAGFGMLVLAGAVGCTGPNKVKDAPKPFGSQLPTPNNVSATAATATPKPASATPPPAAPAGASYRSSQVPAGNSVGPTADQQLQSYNSQNPGRALGTGSISQAGNLANNAGSFGGPQQQRPAVIASSEPATLPAYPPPKSAVQPAGFNGLSNTMPVEPSPVVQMSAVSPPVAPAFPSPGLPPAMSGPPGLADAVKEPPAFRPVP